MPESQRLSFLLLQDIIDQYLARAADEGVWDSYKQRIMELLLRLVRFSYYSTTEQMQRLVPPLIKELNRTDERATANADLEQAVQFQQQQQQQQSTQFSSLSSVSSSSSEKDRRKRGISSMRGRISPVDDDAFYTNTTTTTTLAFGGGPNPSGANGTAQSLRAYWCWCGSMCALTARPDSWQARAYKVVDGLAWTLVVLVAVMVMVGLFVADPSADELCLGCPTPSSTAVTSGVLTIALLVEVGVRWYFYAVKNGKVLYFVADPDSAPFNAIDVSLGTLDLLVLSGLTSGLSFLKAGKALRIIKLVRVARAAKAISKFRVREELVEDSWEMPERYFKTPIQQIQTMLEVVTVLGEVSLVQRDANLAALLEAFKSAHVGGARKDALQAFTDVVDRSPRLASLAQGVLDKTNAMCEPSRVGVEDFEGEFVSGSRAIVNASSQEPASYSRSKFAGGASGRFDEIFLDLCLYHHDGLVQAALNLLMAQHSVRKSLLDDCCAAQLLSCELDELKYHRLSQVLRELQSMAETFELWGDLESPEEIATSDLVKRHLRELTDACMRRRTEIAPSALSAYEPVPQTQTLLFNLGALEVCVTVASLEQGLLEFEHMADATKGQELVKNTKEILTLCNCFLMWFVSRHGRNQLATFEHVDLLVQCFQHDVLAPCVLAEVVRGNVELVKHFPTRIVTECAQRIFNDGRNYAYLELLEALLFLASGNEENNVPLQFAVLKELTRAQRADRVCWLCQDPRGDQYAERIELMKQCDRNKRDADQAQTPENRTHYLTPASHYLTPSMDNEYLPPLLRYQCKLLEVFAGCALGASNITTVEAKLQTLYPPDAILHAILDDRTTLDLKLPLTTFLYHSVIEVEIAVPDFEKCCGVWALVSRFPAALRRAAQVCRTPLQEALAADGPRGVRARLDLNYALLCADFLKVFFERYVTGTITYSEIESSPQLKRCFNSKGELHKPWIIPQPHPTQTTPEKAAAALLHDALAEPVSVVVAESSVTHRSVCDEDGEGEDEEERGTEDDEEQRERIAAALAAMSAMGLGATSTQTDDQGASWLDALMEGVCDALKDLINASDATGNTSKAHHHPRHSQQQQSNSQHHSQAQPVPFVRCAPLLARAQREALYDSLRSCSARVGVDASEYGDEDEEDFGQYHGMGSVGGSTTNTHRQSRRESGLDDSQQQQGGEDERFVLERTPAEAFALFAAQLALSPEMFALLEADNFDIVESFNRLEKLTDLSACAELRLEPLIETLVNHTLERLTPSGNGRKLDAECTRTTRWLVQIFRALIEKKWGMTIDERDEDGGEEQDRAAQQVQEMLNARGVTKLCLSLISVGIDRELALEAIKLCVALLFREGGNKPVQREIYRQLSSGDSDLFFKAVRNYIVEIKNLYVYTEPELVDDPYSEPVIPETCIVLRFLQLTSEGHFQPNQEIMRQQLRGTNINLLDDFVDLLSVLSRDKSRCRSSTRAALQVSATLLEVIQGPCKENQMHLAIHTELIEILNRITRWKPTKDCQRDEDDEVRKTALEIYEGLLEGETGNSVIITRIISVIDLDVLKGIIEQQEPQHTTSTNSSNAPNAKEGAFFHSNSQSSSSVLFSALSANANGGQNPKHEGELSEIQIESLVLLQMFFDYKPELREMVQLSPRVQRLMGRRVTAVEVVWDGVILRRFFPIPSICDHISDATRAKLQLEIDRSSDEARLQDFMIRAKDVWREIKHQALLQDVTVGSFNLAQIFSRRNQEYATWLAFCVALLINAFLLSFAEHPSLRSSSSSSSSSVYMEDDDTSYTNVDNDNAPFDARKIKIKTTSTAHLVMQILSIFNIILSAFTLMLFVTVRCPVKYQSLVEKGCSQIYSICMTFADVMTVYYFVYTVLAGLAIQYKFCSSLLLLDIVVKSATSRDVIYAVVYPRKQLIATAFLCCAVVYIFSFIIFQTYSDDFSYASQDDEDWFPEDCRSLRRCFGVTLMYGMRLSGGSGDIMAHTWKSRLWVDYMYFLIVLIVLLNVVFGIIIDTFSELRSLKQEKERKMNEECFVCGLDNMTFDRASSEPGGFRKHQDEEHKMWDYLNFIIFIWSQDKDEDDGLELYVRAQIEAVDITWLPVGRAICLTSHQVEEVTVFDQIHSLKHNLTTALDDNQQKLLKSMERSADHLRRMMDANAAKQQKRIENLETAIHQHRPKQQTQHLSPQPESSSSPPIDRNNRLPEFSASPLGFGLGEKSRSKKRFVAPMVATADDSQRHQKHHPHQHQQIPIQQQQQQQQPQQQLQQQHSPAHDTLIVRVHGATDLVDTHLLGSGDPFVFARVSLDDEPLGETERIWMSPSPVWPDSPANTFKLANPKKGQIDLELWHCHRRGQGHFLGHASLVWETVLRGERCTLALRRKLNAKSQTYVQGNVDLTAHLLKGAGGTRGAPNKTTPPQSRATLH